MQCHAVFDLLPNASPPDAAATPPPPPPPPPTDFDATEATPLPADYATAASFFAAMDANATKITSTSMAKLVEAAAAEAEPVSSAATPPGTAADVGPAPVLCGTALNVMKFTGWYLRITQVSQRASRARRARPRPRPSTPTPAHARPRTPTNTPTNA
tara:strand:- start:2012 stop:2482 length:471 start_codon:yes stop_codon:yes gene_type:complete